MFKFEKNQFINWTNKKVLDVWQAKDEEGQKVIVHGNNGGANQRWRVMYLDKAVAVQSKGLNKEFGWHINRPFYMVSRLPFHRVIECIGANNLVIKRWRKNTAPQQFTFNGVDKTIRSNHWKNYAMEIQSNGGSTNVRMTSGINSRWW